MSYPQALQEWRIEQKDKKMKDAEAEQQELDMLGALRGDVETKTHALKLQKARETQQAGIDYLVQQKGFNPQAAQLYAQGAIPLSEAQPEVQKPPKSPTAKQQRDAWLATTAQQKEQEIEATIGQLYAQKNNIWRTATEVLQGGNVDNEQHLQRLRQILYQSGGMMGGRPPTEQEMIDLTKILQAYGDWKPLYTLANARSQARKDIESKYTVQAQQRFGLDVGEEPANDPGLLQQLDALEEVEAQMQRQIDELNKRLGR